MAAKLTKKADSKAKKFTSQEYRYDDGIDPKDLLDKAKPAKHGIFGKLFHT